MAINETANGQNSIAITGTATGGNSLGVLGKGEAVGVRGESQNWHAVVGLNTGNQGSGVYGHSTGTGVIGESETWMGVYGKSNSTTGGAGVMGEAVGPGVIGKSQTWHGVYGETQSTTGGVGVWGEDKGSAAGVQGHSNAGIGVFGTSETGIGVFGKGGNLAARFEGDVEVTGDIRLTNADCAEDFEIAGAEMVEPGTVMVLGDEGGLLPSAQAYDKRVAGVISGAGDYKPGIVLDKHPGQGNRSAVALLGKVFCKVDASYASIEVGDLLTTSVTPGHAMKAADPLSAFGAVLGKALRPLREGQGLIPILIALQ